MPNDPVTPEPQPIPQPVDDAVITKAIVDAIGGAIRRLTSRMFWIALMATYLMSIDKITPEQWLFACSGFVVTNSIEKVKQKVK